MVETAKQHAHRLAERTALALGADWACQEVFPSDCDANDEISFIDPHGSVSNTFLAIGTDSVLPCTLLEPDANGDRECVVHHALAVVAQSRPDIGARAEKLAAVVRRSGFCPFTPPVATNSGHKPSVH